MTATPVWMESMVNPEKMEDRARMVNATANTVHRALKDRLDDLVLMEDQVTHHITSSYQVRRTF